MVSDKAVSPSDSAGHGSRAQRLREVAFVFGRLGATAFGGPAAHVAMMDDACVRVRGWLSREEFADSLSVSNVLPGPGSTELAMLLGLRRAGWPGLVVAGVAFIAPTTLLVWCAAWWYARVGSQPDIASVLRGLQPVAFALVMQASWRLARTVVRSWTGALLAACGVALLLPGFNELLMLLCVALLSMYARSDVFSRLRGGFATTLLLGRETAIGLGAGAAGAITGVIPSVTLPSLWWSCLRIGGTVFGSGYVLLAYLRAEFVERHAWLVEGQLLDAFAIGQLTPGPVFSTVTFVGYLVAGHTGAVVATVGVFAPAFIFAAFGATIATRVRRSPVASAAMDGINAGSVALLITVLWSMSRGFTPRGLIAASVCLILLQFTRVPSILLFVVGASAGYFGIIR